MDKVQICSSVSVQFGKGPINSLTESGNSAFIASIFNNVYDQERDELLREGFWNCCMKRVILAPDTTIPAFNYSARFKLPSDFIRLYSINDAYFDTASCINYAIEDGYILASGNALRLSYIYRNENESTWDSKLTGLMIARLMWKTCYALTNSTSKEDALEQRYLRMAVNARAIDSQESPSQPLSNDYAFITGRY